MLRRFKSFYKGSDSDLSEQYYSGNLDINGDVPLTFPADIQSMEMTQLALALTNCIDRFNKTELTDDDVRKILRQLAEREKPWVIQEAPLFPGDLRTDDNSLGAQKNMQNRQKAKERLATSITRALQNGQKKHLVIDSCLSDDDVRAVLTQLYARDPGWKQVVKFKKQKKTGVNNAYWIERAVIVKF